jgi:hypothetical protein
LFRVGGRFSVRRCRGRNRDAFDGFGLRFGGQFVRLERGSGREGSHADTWDDICVGDAEARDDPEAWDDFRPIRNR